ncbi:hypothetical protein K438DRAFT_2007789 [Mycena galopus ATCC 62051]|nr:hypothetical protein K438DRAFT_2007789 [Mycena galopus ATCC 62051]
MTTTLIPRPKWRRSKVKYGNLEELREAMPGWTTDKFQTFKEYIQSTANHLELDTYSPLEDQDPIKQQKLRNDLCSSPLAPLSSCPPTCAQRVTQPKMRPPWGPCVFCGYQPPVPAEETAKLRQCLNNRADLLTCLAHTGVVAEHHFRILLRLSESRHNDFLSELASADKLTWVERFEIQEALEVYLEKNPDLGSVERPRKVRLTAVRRPKEGLENVLAVHTCKHSDVQRHLQIEDDTEYFDLVDLVERWSPLYLDISIPFGEQDEDTLDTFVGLISEEKPSLRRYDDCWPVYLLIWRFLCAHAAGLPRTPRESAAAGGSATANAPPQHQCPKLLTYPPSNVPPSITALLEDYSMEELGPAFLFFGFSSDAKFTSIVTSRRAKENLLDGLRARMLECSEFQLLMLHYVVERA